MKFKRSHMILAACLGIVVVLGAMALVLVWDADPDEPLSHEAHFPISCGDNSQRHFDHATSLLHSLRYGDAERAYTAIARDDPDCAVVYWGIAMSRLKRPIAAPPAAEDIRVAAQALQGAIKARTASHRERAYVAAVSGLVAQDALTDWHSRTLVYEKAMAELVREYPDDREASIFYALALNMATLPSDKSYAKQTKATELLLVALSEQPNHPGLVHYLTYCIGNASPSAREPTPQGAGMKAQTRRVLLGGLGALLAIGVCSLVILGPAWAEGISSSIGGPFTLTSGNRRVVSDQDFRGKWLLVYFGYTHCPDVCPTTLLDLSETLQQLGPFAAEVQPVFITIDPERDTPEAVSDYLEAFDPRIVGLSGTPAEIAKVAKEYLVYYRKQEPVEKNSEDYLMEHSAFVYVIGPTGAYVTLFSPRQGQGPDLMAARLRELIARAQPQ